jgi:uncharacterized protein YjdB
MFVGQSVTIAATLTNSPAGVTFSSTNSSVVSVNATTGVSTCLAVGSAFITARSQFTPDLSASVNITCVTLFDITPASLSFTHVIGTSPCAQAIGTVTVTNRSAQPLTITLSGHSALSVDTGTATVVIPAAGSRAIAVSFNCSTQTSFVGTVTLSAAAGNGITEVKSVTVNGTIQ